MPDAAILFDLDGVLVDSWRVAKHALSLALQDVAYSGEIPFDAFRMHLGKPLAVILHALDLPAAAERPFNHHAMQLVEQVQIFPDVERALKGLRANGVAVGVVTGKARWRSVPILEKTGIAGLVDALVTPEDAPGKPDPRAVWHCLAMLRVRSAHCFVGDAAADCAAAKAASIPAALALWGLDNAVPAGEWDVLFDTPQDVLDYIFEKTQCSIKVSVPETSGGFRR